MAKQPENTEVSSEQEIETCGVIMPISPTSNHDELHWRTVQQLIHRAINKAGFKPHNVWEGSATDRITNRILSNLFSDSIAVCDISDLNANVMLELGMRLSSKKPTIVVRENGAKIPFDIADFSVLSYPSDLSILLMEDFIEKLSIEIKDKADAYAAGHYHAFLSNIEIEFLEPSVKAVPFQGMVASQLEDISKRLSRIEGVSSQDLGIFRETRSPKRREVNAARCGSFVTQFNTPFSEKYLDEIRSINGVVHAEQIAGTAYIDYEEIDKDSTSVSETIKDTLNRIRDEQKSSIRLIPRRAHVKDYKFEDR